MGGLFGRRKPSTSSSSGGSAPFPMGGSGEFPNDNARRMPVFGTPSQEEAANRQRQRIVARSGRESTRLVADRGTRAFVNSFLGEV